MRSSHEQQLETFKEMLKGGGLRKVPIQQISSFFHKTTALNLVKRTIVSLKLKRNWLDAYIMNMGTRLTPSPLRELEDLG